ncbi:MAG: hypothetical protein ACRDHM_03325 [Actinomycetota bacterium]
MATTRLGVSRVVASAMAAALLVLVACGGQGSDSSPEDRLRAQAQDRSAQSDLRNALTTAKVYYTENETYSGLDPAMAGTIEPSLTWKGNEPASPGAVTINLTDATVAVFSTLSESGQAFCIADDSAAITYGRQDAVDARSVGDCSASTTAGW